MTKAPPDSNETPGETHAQPRAIAAAHVYTSVYVYEREKGAGSLVADSLAQSSVHGFMRTIKVHHG